jgi:hypothetical protein
LYDDYIFAKPTFLRGVGRVVDLGGSLTRAAFIISDSPAEADRRALASDVRIIARDMNAALAAVEADVKEQK